MILGLVPHKISNIRRTTVRLVTFRLLINKSKIKIYALRNCSIIALSEIVV